MSSFYLRMHFLCSHTMRKTIRLKSGVGFGLTNSPLSTAKVLIDAVGYVCSESVKCDDCLPRTLEDELTLNQN